MRLIAFFSNFERTLFELHESDFFLNLRIDSRLYVLAIGLKFPKSAGNFSRKSRPKCKPAKIHISPYFCQGPWGQNLQGTDRGREPSKGANSKKCHAPKMFDPHFLENVSSNFLKNFYARRGHLNLKFPHGRFRPPDP